jgi:hypothetical protein
MAENPSVLGPTRTVDRGGTERRTFSLMEVAQETGIAMPILLRYKREYPERIPSQGSGSQQRFPEEAFDIFAELHRKESEQRDLPRRGGFGLLSLPRLRRDREAPAHETRTGDEAQTEGDAQTATADTSAAPAPSSSAPAEPIETPAANDAPAAPAKPRTGAATLTLKAISDELGIAYPTIARYATKHEERIPHVGEGRKRRFPPEAIEVFRQIRKESKPGRPPKAKTQKRRAAARVAEAALPAAPTPAAAAPTRSPEVLVRRIEQLERHQQQLETMVRSLREEIERPMTAIVERA